MGFWRTTGKLFSPINNFAEYIGVRRVAEGAGFIVGLAKWLLTPETAARKETFEEAMQRLNLTEQDLEKRKQEFTRLVWILGTATLFTLLYAIYLYLNLYIRGALAATSLTLLAAVLTFRYHFWLFQIRRRHLGCTFRDWFKRGLLGGGLR